jgi:hypothetical protein
MLVKRTTTFVGERGGLTVGIPAELQPATKFREMTAGKINRMNDKLERRLNG